MTTDNAPYIRPSERAASLSRFKYSSTETNTDAGRAAFIISRDKLAEKVSANQFLRCKA